MKRFLQIISITIVLVTGLSVIAQAKTLIIGLSPVLNQKDAKTQSIEVLKFLTQNLQPGESAMIFDAWEQKFIGTFFVPDKTAYKSEKAKLQANRKLVVQLMQRSKADHSLLEDTIIGAVKLPQALSFLARNYGAFEDTDIVILGSPVYVDLQTPAWDMRGGRYPGDGHFSIEAERSIFSTLGKENFLKGARIHIGFPDKEWTMNESYAHVVRRMWTLYIEAQGGILSSFTDDKATLWNRVGRSAEALPHNFQREITDKLETLIVPPAQDKIVSIHERKLTTIIPASNVLRMAQNVEIGIRWICKSCDLDLYVRPNHVAEVLYFGNTKTDLGLYHKDFVRSPQTVNGYETVTFTSAVDLHSTLIALNFYDGQSIGNVTGEIRLAIGDKTYGLPFEITSNNGNKSAGREKTLKSGKPANKNWLVIAPKAILGLK